MHTHIRLKAYRKSEQGYILLTLLLVICMMIIFAAAIVPSITFNIRRDREEEMIHRGVQYSRAIRAYYKKFGRYPTKIEDLENTSNMRFLRKRYKDPLNCKNSKCEDFKLLHFGDVQLTLSGGMGGGGINGATPVNGASPFGSQTPAGGRHQSFGQNWIAAFGRLAAGSAERIRGWFQFRSRRQRHGHAGARIKIVTNTPAGSDPSQTGTPGTAGTGTDDSSSATGANSSSPFGQSGNGQSSNQLGASGQVIGGPIVGVATALKSDDPTIREFNHKKKYKDWLFVYDPSQDRGQLITTPYQPPLPAIRAA